MSWDGEQGKDGMEVLTDAAIKKAFEPYADGTNDFELFEAGFKAGVHWTVNLSIELCKISFEEQIKEMKEQ